jgi:hypothetical protein
MNNHALVKSAPFFIFLFFSSFEGEISFVDLNTIGIWKLNTHKNKNQEQELGTIKQNTRDASSKCSTKSVEILISSIQLIDH